MQFVPLSPVPATPSTAEWMSTYLPALVGRTQVALHAVDELRSRHHSQQPIDSLAWATRALWVVNRSHRAETLLGECLHRGGIRAAELGTFSHPRHGIGYAWVRLALAEDASSAAEAHCDLAILAAQRGENHRAMQHVEQALDLDPEHLETIRWHRLLTDHGACLARWLKRRVPVSAEAACRLLDLWPDTSNGYLSPARFRAVRKRTRSSC